MNERPSIVWRKWNSWGQGRVACDTIFKLAIVLTISVWPSEVQPFSHLVHQHARFRLQVYSCAFDIKTIYFVVHLAARNCSVAIAYSVELSAGFAFLRFWTGCTYTRLWPVTVPNSLPFWRSLYFGVYFFGIVCVSRFLLHIRTTANR